MKYVIEILGDWVYRSTDSEALRPGVTVVAHIGFNGVASYHHPATGEPWVSYPGYYQVVRPA